MRYCTVVLLCACTVVFDMYIHVCVPSSSLRVRKIPDSWVAPRHGSGKSETDFQRETTLYVVATPLSSTLYSTVSFLLNIFLRMSILAFTLPVTSRQLLSMLVVDMCL